MVQSIEVNDHGGKILSSRPSVISSVIIVILVFSAVGGYVFISNQYAPSNVAVVVIDPGFGDRSMADQAYDGLFTVDVVIDYDFRVAEDVADLTDIIDTIASNRNHDLILVIGTEVGLAAAVESVAGDNPNQRFGFVGGFVDQPNVASATFAHDEAAFLAGALAAFLAVDNVNRSGIVGIISSVASDATVTELIDGFIQGLTYANTTHNLGVTLLPQQFIGSYNDSTTAQARAQNMWNPNLGNATVIFAPVRASIEGIRAAMEYANQTWFSDIRNREPFIIAAEGDQNYMGNPDIEIATGPSWVVTSVVPRSDLATYRIINAMLWDNFTGGVDYGGGFNVPGNLQNNGTILADMEEFQNELWVTGAMINMTIDYRLAIVNGTITIP
ncbi:MAG: BMP family ABC transporter substrate-binding protein [Candidatus Thorarchaeota archaeon]|jgi:basic membrane protein A